MPACAWTEQGLGGPACVIMSKHCSPRHCQGSDLHSLLCLAARETGRYLHLPPVRAHGREAHCLHPGSQEPEEDGCGGPLRWVLLRGSLSPPHWGTLSILCGGGLWGHLSGRAWESPPVPPHALEAAQGLAGGRGETGMGCVPESWEGRFEFSPPWFKQDQDAAGPGW